MRTTSTRCFALVCALVTTVGCGKESGNSVPSISNLHFDPSEVLQGDGGGSVLAMGTFDFTDPGGDLVAVHLSTSGGQTVDAAITGVDGVTAGTLSGALTVDSSVIGHFTFQLWVTDAAGNESNSLSGAFDVRPNDSGSHWTYQVFPEPPDPTTFRFLRVRWLRSQFWAVGSAVLRSTDGVTWLTSRQEFLADIAWAGSQFVLVGRQTVLTSPDGVAWTPRDAGLAPGDVLLGVASSGTRIVAVGFHADPTAPDDMHTILVTSLDGVTWVRATMDLPGYLMAVVWSDRGFVAVGERLGGSIATGLIATSTDGTTWTTPFVDATGELRDVAWNGSLLVAVGYPGAFTSSDGSTWQRSGVAQVGDLHAVAWGLQGFLACAYRTCFGTADGLSWTGFDNSMEWVSGLAWSGTRWVAVGFNGVTPFIATSP